MKLFFTITVLLLSSLSFAQSGKGKAEKKTADTDSIARTIGLGEVVITAPVRETYMRGDTTMINAGAIKTPEGAYLEELLKRVPGLVYDSRTKTMTYNGKPIKGLNLNGKEFFKNDMKTALENIPAEVVGKIKVYDRRSELEKITKVRQGGENYVLDLQTKRKFNGMLMTSAEASRGSHDRKEAALSGMMFRDNGENAMVNANTGNRRMNTDYPGNKQQNLSLNLSKNIGKDLSIFANGMYGNQVYGNENTSYNEQYLTTGNRYLYSAGNNVNSNRNVNGNMGLTWKHKDDLFLNVYANIGHSSGSATGSNRQATYTANPGLSVTDPFGGDAAQGVPKDTRLNDISMNNTSTNKNDNINVSADLTKRLNKQGTSLSLTTQLSSGRGKSKAFTLSNTTYYQLKNRLGGDSVMVRNQFTDSPSRNSNATLGLMLTQPVGKRLHLQASYRYSMSRERSSRNTYDLTPMTEAGSYTPGLLPEGYEQGYTDSLSNRSQSRTTAHEMQLSLNYNDDRWNVNAGLTVRPERRTLTQKTGLLEADTVRSSVNFTPMVYASWNKGQMHVELRYSGNTQQPSLESLLALTDNSDPLNITRGNPGLKPAYTQTFGFSAGQYDAGLSVDASFTNTYNSQTQAVIYNLTTGGRESYPVNINGNWNANASLRYNKRFLKYVNVSAALGSDMSENVGLVNEGNHEQPDRSVTRGTSYNGSLTLGYTPQWGGFDVSGEWRYMHSSNKLRGTNDYTRNYSFRANAFAELPAGFQVRTDAAYSFRNGTNITPGADDQVLWNASVTWRFLKKRRAELSFSWNDILSDKKNFYRNVTSEGLSESHNRQIAGYVLLTFRYKLNIQV